MECSGLEDIWVEAGIFGVNTVTIVFDGKAYYRAMRKRLLTYEALWRLPYGQHIHDACENLRKCIQEKGITDLLHQFEVHMSKVNNFAY